MTYVYTHEYRYMHSDTLYSLYKVIKDYSHVIVHTECARPGVCNQYGRAAEI